MKSLPPPVYEKVIPDQILTPVEFAPIKAKIIRQEKRDKAAEEWAKFADTVRNTAHAWKDLEEAVKQYKEKHTSWGEYTAPNCRCHVTVDPAEKDEDFTGVSYIKIDPAAQYIRFDEKINIMGNIF